MPLEDRKNKTQMNKLPEMTVEARESTTAHGINPPNTQASYLDQDIQEVILLNEYAKTLNSDHKAWEILANHLPFIVTPDEIDSAVIDFGDKTKNNLHFWSEICVWVRDDMCAEFFNMALKYCLAEGQKHKAEKDFIDGSGIGYLRKYTNRLKKTLEEAFDAKYFFKLPRPLEYLRDNKGFGLMSLAANHIHPGHWSYPAGHGTKFLTAVEVLDDVFHLDQKCYRNLLIVACVYAHGRSGNLIHFLQDNLAGGQLTDLKEFA